MIRALAQATHCIAMKLNRFLWRKFVKNLHFRTLLMYMQPTLCSCTLHHKLLQVSVSSWATTLSCVWSMWRVATKWLTRERSCRTSGIWGICPKHLSNIKFKHTYTQGCHVQISVVWEQGFITLQNYSYLHWQSYILDIGQVCTTDLYQDQWISLNGLYRNYQSITIHVAVEFIPCIIMHA